MNKILAILLFAGFTAATYGATIEQQGKEILDKADRRYFPYEGSMDIFLQGVQSDGSKLEYRMQAYKKGTQNQTVVWVSPAINKNDVGIRSGDTIYYKPLKATKPDIMSYQALFMNTGFSWGDIISSDIAMDYKTVKLENVKEDGKDCYLLQLKPVKDNLYARIDVWVDRSTDECVKRLYYTASGDKLKIANYSDIKVEKGNVVSVRVDMEDYFQETKSYALLTSIQEEKLPGFFFNTQNIGRIHAR